MLIGYNSNIHPLGASIYFAQTFPVVVPHKTYSCMYLIKSF